MNTAHTVESFEVGYVRHRIALVARGRDIVVQVRHDGAVEVYRVDDGLEMFMGYLGDKRICRSVATAAARAVREVLAVPYVLADIALRGAVEKAINTKHVAYMGHWAMRVVLKSRPVRFGARGW